MNEAVEDPAAVSPGRRRRTVRYGLAVAAIIIQLLLVSTYYFPMGLGWGGFGYLANMAQGVIILVVAVLLTPKRPLLVLPLPVLSLLLMLALQALTLRVTECSQEELSAVAELAPPPGSPPLSFQSYPHSGCVTEFYISLSGKRVLDHYRRAATNAGWQVEPGDVSVEPGQGSFDAGNLYLHNATMTVEVRYESGGEEGPLRDQTAVVVSVYERDR